MQARNGLIRSSLHYAREVVLRICRLQPLCAGEVLLHASSL